MAAEQNSVTTASRVISVTRTDTRVAGTIQSFGISTGTGWPGLLILTRSSPIRLEYTEAAATTAPTAPPHLIFGNTGKESKMLKVC